jgi:G3E family GTPase
MHTEYYPSRIVKEEARRIAYQLTLQDILFLAEVLNAYTEVHEQIKRALERYQRLTRTYTTPTSLQEELLRKIFLEKTETKEEEEEEEELDEETEQQVRQQTRSKLFEILQKARERTIKKEIQKAEKDLARAKELGLVDEEVEKRIKQYIESKKREIGEIEKPEEKEEEKEIEEEKQH